MDLQEAMKFLSTLGSDQYVDKYKQVDMKTETLLFDGREIRPGMVIVSAEEDLREGLDLTIVSLTIRENANRRIQERNRWFYVLRVEIVRGEVFLLALHQDGQVTKKTGGINESWLVKNESLCKCVACKTLHYNNGLVWGFDKSEKIDSETTIDYKKYVYFGTDLVEKSNDGTIEG